VSAFDEIGGDRLRALLRDFYDRVFADAMIGFLFVGKNKERLIQKEWELAARMLGGDVTYTGRPIAVAHAKSPITGGHFERRLELLRQAMAAHDVPESVRQVWIDHTQRLRRQVTADASSECDHDADEARRGLASPPDEVDAGDAHPGDAADPSDAPDTT